MRHLPPTTSGGSTGAGFLATLLVATTVACTVQPIGWEGAGRMQELPGINMDGGGAMEDAGTDAGTDAGSSSSDDTSGSASSTDSSAAGGTSSTMAETSSTATTSSTSSKATSGSSH